MGLGLTSDHAQLVTALVSIASPLRLSHPLTMAWLEKTYLMHANVISPLQCIYGSEVAPSSMLPAIDFLESSPTRNEMIAD